MEKKIVTPRLHPSETDNRLRRAAGAGSRRTHAEILTERREYLHQFASDALKTSRRRRSARRAHLTTGAQGRRSTYQILEGLGMLLMDEEACDEDALRAEMDAVVLDNVRIASVTPRTTTSSAVEPDLWSLEKINAPALRSQGITGEGIVVGVLDSGIYATHKEFEGKQIWFAQFDRHGQKVELPAKDFGKHGTHVSGLVAGKHAGVAPGASLAVAAVLTKNGGTAGYLAQILAGLNWLLTTNFCGDPETPGVHVINASLEAARGYKDFLYGALTTALAVPGILMISAVGNFGSLGPNQCSSPGNYDIVLGVGATDPHDNIASFSAWGTIAECNNTRKPDLCAPGVAVWSSAPGSGNRYQKIDGTSQACPLVSGAAALLMQQDPSLIHNPTALRDALLKHTVPLEDEVRGGRGRLQL